MPSRIRLILHSLILCSLFVFLAAPLTHTQQSPVAPKTLYEHIRAFELSGGSTFVENLTLQRDRAEITLTSGTLYFTSPIAGRVTGAVFRGQGTLKAEVPPTAFEQDNLRRMLNADRVESDFQSAVLVFTDDTYDRLSAGLLPAAVPPPEASKLASELLPRVLKETGMNLAARATGSILDKESPGFFFAQFDGGRRGRFSLLLDFQTRLPVANFTLNGGEKGLLFTYRKEIFGNDIWMAFFSLEEYKRGIVAYSDTNDLVDIEKYAIDTDLRDPRRSLKYSARIELTVRAPHLHAIPFALGEGLSEYDNIRLKKQLRVKSARISNSPADFIQEDWEGGFTVLLPSPLSAGQKLSLELDVEGDFMLDSERFNGAHYPRSNTDWIPRHGYLDRATYHLTFRHRKDKRVAASGLRTAEGPDPESKDFVITEYKLDSPVSLATFAIGPFQRHAQKIKWEKGGETPLEFNSMPGSHAAIKEDFIMAELDNSVRYFTAMFGEYPYSSYGAVVHPYGFGQGLATMLTIPPADRTSKYTFAFISHETAHQWWGNIVAWRSYRDQWLSEGFAEYSGMMYTGRRDGHKSQRELIQEGRDLLRYPPGTTTGIGKGRLNDVGPIILGLRLSTSKTFGAYQVLIYQKGALVLRMLHFLFTDPGTGNGQPFFDMMTDFVNRYRNKAASTDDFRLVANQHFANTPIAKKYGVKDLDWFFHQWVYQTPLPTYRLDYVIDSNPDGSVQVRGTVFQENAPADWFTVLPLVFTFDGNQVARGTVHAHGPQTPMGIKLPARPKKVELDPDLWVLSEKTSTRGR